jgi:hypothetical protein
MGFSPVNIPYHSRMADSLLALERPYKEPKLVITKMTLVIFLFYLIRFFLLREWENNKESLLTFLEQVHMGIKGSGNGRLNPSLKTYLKISVVDL